MRLIGHVTHMGEMRNKKKKKIAIIIPGGEKSRHGWVNDIKRILKKLVQRWMQCIWFT
jgi:hypothetical protein